MAKPKTAKHDRGGGTVLVRTVDRLLACATQAGLDRRKMIDLAGLHDVDFTQPDTHAPISRFVALWQLLAKMNLEAGFGVRFGSSLRVRDVGLVGYAMYYSATLEAAVRRWIRFSRIVDESVVFRLEAARNQRIVAQPAPPLEVSTQPEIDYRITAVLAACRELTGMDIVPVEVTFPYARPRSTFEHQRWFRCPLRFGHRLSSMVLANSDITLPIARGDERLAGYLSEYAEQVLRTMTTGNSVTERTRSALWAHLSEGRPSLTRIASTVGMAPRTLQRRLAAEGTSFQEELDHLRKTMATATLLDARSPVNEVAFLLGYSEPSTFYRSFKRWTGKTPEEFRRAS